MKDRLYDISDSSLTTYLAIPNDSSLKRATSLPLSAASFPCSVSSLGLYPCYLRTYWPKFTFKPECSHQVQMRHCFQRAALRTVGPRM
nr:12192_t:CDS:2 [Entrophospora candida]